MSNVYKQDGVDVVAGDSFSEFAGRICRESYSNSPFVQVHDHSRGHFRGPRSFTLHNLPHGYSIDLAPDGVGTKVIVVTAVNFHHLVARDLVAMCCGDITRWGGLPLIFTNVLDVSSLGSQEADQGSTEYLRNILFRRMMQGLSSAATEQRLVVFKGETAELGTCVGSDDPDAVTKFNWAGTALGVYHKDRMITGDDVADGDYIIALREEGFRSNGISSVRKALAIRYGPEWYKMSDNMDVAAAAEPSVLYDRFLTQANGWYSTDRPHFISAIIHLTGGAIKSKLAEDILFPRGLSANLDDLWDPPEIMRKCADWRGMNDQSMYETWNGGQGALVVVHPRSAQTFVYHARKEGIDAKICGRIVRSSTKQYVRILSKYKGEEIVFYEP